MLRRHILRFKKQIMSRYRDGFFNRVLAPEGEILCKTHPWVLPFGLAPNPLPADLSFAPPRQLLCLQTTPVVALLYLLYAPEGVIHAVEKKVSKDKSAGSRFGCTAHEVRVPGRHESEGGPIAASSCAPRFCRGSAEWAPAFMPCGYLCPAGIYALRVFGLVPTKPAVLGAANGG
ncbi:hypothetical protein AADEFJLK_04371 [Methylovulum psychrotolerans]|uniref:Uncharacterized protein n=1 Tax=Methylovulum psychrotolerans TaxID=1704499 RepID=A0A2S5CGC2_9GAMM|nr:hypothetical protein AADEFJLK_04371 [Methylovulum psychrotolerans]